MASMWDDCPWLSIIDRPNDGVAFFDTFLMFGDAGNPYHMAGDASPVWFGSSDPANGGYGFARGSVSDTDNNEAYLGSSDTTTFMRIPATGGGKWWWECRFKVDSITDRALFFGFIEAEAITANMLVDNTGEVADAGLIGFQALCASPTTLRSIYRTAGETKVVAATTASAIVADTFVTVGMKYDPATGLYYYINDVAVEGLEYDAVTDATYIPASALTFPDAVNMTFAVGVKTGTTAAVILDVDWWRFAASFYIKD